MENFFKKYSIFIAIAALIIVVFINFIYKSPNDKLKNYLVKQGFIYNSDSELIQENMSLENYENDDNNIYINTTFDYNNSIFYLINRSKEDGYENIYNLSYNIINGSLTGDYKKENEYDTWYIDANLFNDNFTCDTGGYKGMAEYCDFLKEKMEEFKMQISLYLMDSDTSKYYTKKMNS